MVQGFSSFGWPASLAVLALMAARASGGFTVRDLGAVATPVVVVPGGARFPSTSAGGINASGATAGAEQDAPSTQHAVSATAEGKFQAVAPPMATSNSSASGINAGGSVAGSFLDTMDNRMHAFAGVNGKAVDLGTLATGRDASASGINSSNQVAGSGTLADFSERAFRADASSGAMTTIKPLAGGTSNYGNGINDAGWVVGTSGVGSGYVHAFVFDGKASVDLATGAEGTAFGANSQGMAINNKNFVAGFADVGSYQHAFLTSVGGPMIDIGVSGGYTSSYAYGLNDLQQVVGAMDQGGSAQAAFAWAPGPGGRGPIDLNTLLDPADRNAWHLVMATGINDSEQICGEAFYNGAMHGFVLTPDSIATAFLPFGSVPAPPAVVLAALGLGLALGWSKVRLRLGRTGVRAAARATPPMNWIGTAHDQEDQSLVDRT